ncbi:transglycosylase domain-containing protein [Streptacidiphilus fuscans]|uniref:Penicillin-binding protein n=1 Tax=Streptacidiphilus fuscans TaxID=2789292 RepID=A0A931B756_9ACTN|nr:transglycosylase domain-containing protein [Streptacidiphilus fuscans]MBF9068145.1 penicillin-binding protein [Streptacidiphilus fuscans]
MSEHRRKPPQNGRRPDGPTSAGRGSVGSNASGGLPPRRTTARPQPGGAPGQTAAQPRMTRAEMRRAAQGKGGGGGSAGPGRGSRGAGKQPPSGPKPKRLIDYPRWGKSGVRRWLPSWKLVLSTFLVIFGGLTGVVGYAYASVSIPSANAASQLQGNVYYWDDGKTVMATTGYNRQNVSLADVPQDIQHDFMAAEDETFETNSGVDPMSILRAVRNMATGGSVQSGSTITQQYVKNVYLNSQQTASRKLKEILISIKIGNGGMSKDQVLEGYLNTNYYGRGAYGIEAAAEAYYGVHANQLTLSEGAFIAATVNQPSTFQNVDTDKTALSIATGRWQYVLSRMVVNNWMTQADEQEALAKGFPSPQKWKHNPGLTGQVGYLVDLATTYAESHSSGQLTDALLARGGYKIYTTFNKADVDALSSSVQKMESQHINPKVRTADQNVQVGAASVNPANGELKAIYGGVGMDKGYYVDNANTLGVPVGSTFKPIDLAAAMTNGAVQTPNGTANPITPDSKYNADDCLKIHRQDGSFIQDNSGTSACPEPDGLLHQANDSTAMPGYQTLRYAMENSINTPYVQLGEDVGYSNVEKMALGVGLNESSLQTDTAGFYIGTSTPSAIRMADAYATFADQGMEHEPVSVKQVTYEGTTESWLPAETAKYAMSQQVANTVTNVLQSVVQKGTGTNAQALGRPAAGKTGTTDDYKSAWFIGYTPQLSTSVVLYKEDPVKGQLESMAGVGGYPKVFGADMPTQVWTDYMSAALNTLPTVQFPTPQPFTQLGSNEPGMPAPSPTTQPTPTASATASASSTASTNPSGQPSDTSSPSPSNTGCSISDIFSGNCNTSSPSGGPSTNPSPTGRHHGGGNPSGPATAGTNNVPGG